MSTSISTSRKQSEYSARPSVSVVIPAMNEAKNLPHVAALMPKDAIDEIIFVDGHSVDNTVEVATELWPDARIITQTRKGKGNALACGFLAATKDIVVMIDADGSTNPAEIPAFIDALVDGADFAKGSRFVRGGGSSDITPMRLVGNKFLNGLVNRIFRTKFTDLCYGYNAFWRDVIATMELASVEDKISQWGDGFEIETLINVRVATAGLSIKEIPSYEQDRIFGESNLNAYKDGMRVLRTILKERKIRAMNMKSQRRQEVTRLKVRSSSRSIFHPAPQYKHKVAS
ncbi:MAG: glycosyltransferase family 2 protein [Mycobacteriaceae bacterium]